MVESLSANMSRKLIISKQMSDKNQKKPTAGGALRAPPRKPGSRTIPLRPTSGARIKEDGNLNLEQPKHNQAKIDPIVKPNRAKVDVQDTKTHNSNIRADKSLHIASSEAIEPLDPRSLKWGRRVSQEHSPINLGRKAPHQPSSEKPKALNARQILTFENEPDDLDDDVQGDEKIEGFRPNILPHQWKGIHFMSRRENGRKYARGGLLCDDMGLGKTLQSIGLILYRPPPKESKVRTTLVVGPLAVMDQWKDEIHRMAPGLKVKTHQGAKRTGSIRELQDSTDVVITTYDTVVSESSRDGALFASEWYRIIADEAHVLRNSKSQVSKEMANLKSDGRRWCLTGTPVHNSVKDLYGLFRFIQVDPYGLSETKFEDLAYKLDAVRTVLATLMIRRSQSILGELLPKLSRERYKIDLSPSEFQAYRLVQPDRKKAAVERNQFFACLSRMRIACNGLLEIPEKVGGVENLEAVPSHPNEVPSLPSEDNVDDLTAMLGGLGLAEKVDDRNSKVHALIKLLKQTKASKTVVFSSFTTMLHVLQPALEQEGITCAIYEGKLRADRRKAILAEFGSSSGNIRVLLCSLHCAAVGLNLTAASQVIMIEPWWNPQIVDQAVKRVHRLGQVQNVQCLELMARNTLEERIFVIQERKRELAKKLVEDNTKSIEKLSDQDREFLLYG